MPSLTLYRIAPHVHLSAKGTDYQSMINDALCIDCRGDHLFAAMYGFFDGNADPKILDLADKHIREVLKTCDCLDCVYSDHPCDGDGSCRDYSICKGCVESDIESAEINFDSKGV